jgi:hypothetical protein
LVAIGRQSPDARARQWLGVGFFVSSDGFLVTGQDVIIGAKSSAPGPVIALLADGTVQAPSCVTSDEKTGLAVLRILSGKESVPLFLSTLEPDTSPKRARVPGMYQTGGREAGNALAWRVLPTTCVADAQGKAATRAEPRLLIHEEIPSLFRGAPLLLSTAPEVIGIVISTGPQPGGQAVAVSYLQTLLAQARDLPLHSCDEPRRAPSE